MHLSLKRWLFESRIHREEVWSGSSDPADMRGSPTRRLEKSVEKCMVAQHKLTVKKPAGKEKERIYHYAKAILMYSHRLAHAPHYDGHNQHRNQGGLRRLVFRISFHFPDQRSILAEQLPPRALSR